MPEDLRLAIRSIGVRGPVLGKYVSKYVEDVHLHIASLRMVLEAGARVVYIVGNSRFYDVLLSTERLYAEALAAYGFAKIDVVPIRKRMSQRELFEFAVTAEAPASPPRQP